MQWLDPRDRVALWGPQSPGLRLALGKGTADDVAAHKARLLGMYMRGFIERQGMVNGYAWADSMVAPLPAPTHTTKEDSR